jgi:hypothetical protein
MWSFDKNRAARFLHCLRTFDRNVAGSSEVAEIVNWAEDHEQSLQWIFTGNIDEMICKLAYHSLQFAKFASRLDCFKCGRMRISFSRRDRASEGLPLSLSVSLDSPTWSGARMVGRRQSRRLDSFAGGFAVCAA